MFPHQVFARMRLCMRTHTHQPPAYAHRTRARCCKRPVDEEFRPWGQDETEEWNEDQERKGGGREEEREQRRRRRRRRMKVYSKLMH